MGYRAPCERARDLFELAGHPVKCLLLNDAPHRYQPTCEDEVCRFFLSCELPTEIEEFWHVVVRLRGGCGDQAMHLEELHKHLRTRPLLVSDLCATGLFDKLLSDFRD